MNRFAWLRPTLAIAASFIVYLLPVFTVHISIPWGVVLWMELTRLAGERNVLWLVMDLGFALLLQAAAGALVYWAIGGWRWWRTFLLIGAIPVFFVALQLGYQIAIPTLFLIEKEEHGEHGDWQAACTVPGAQVAQVDAGSSLALEHAEEAWAVSQADGFSLLTMPECSLSKLPIAFSRTVVEQVAPGGGALFTVSDPSGALTRYGLAPGGEPRIIKRPTGIEHWKPVLDYDGVSVAWLERERTTDKIGTRWRIRSRRLTDGFEETVTLQLERPTSFELIAADTAHNRFFARRNEREFVWIDQGGAITYEPFAPNPDTEPTQRYSRLKDGWASWDVYRDEGRHRVAWSLPAGKGMHEVLKGRGIHDVSLSPDGRLIAVSVGPNTRIGSLKDSLYVLRAADGVEVFRRILPPYSRSKPAFLGNSHLAMTVPREGQTAIAVLKIPQGVR